MLLRMLATQFLRQAAERKIVEEVSKMRQGQQGAADPNAAQDKPVEPPIQRDIAMVFAMSVETGGVIDLMKDVQTARCHSFLEHLGVFSSQPVVVAETGVGAEHASKATDDLIAMYRPSWIVSAGFAGALDERMRRGHILMADHVADVEGNQLDVGLNMDPQVIESTKGLHVGRLLTVDRIIRTPDERRELYKQHDALACDMESAAVANVCRRDGVRFLSVRVISDTVDDELPEEIEKLIGQNSLAGKLGVAAGALFRRPGVAKDAWKLKEDAMKASERLAKFLVGVIPQLVTDPIE